jgi:hypothetical protein
MSAVLCLEAILLVSGVAQYFQGRNTELVRDEKASDQFSA